MYIDMLNKGSASEVVGQLPGITTTAYTPPPHNIYAPWF